MEVNKFYEIARKLAKSNYYQTLYFHSKELGLKIFKNNSDFTRLQIYFLNQLNKYDNLITEIRLKEVSDKILDNPIYEEAYLYYKQHKEEKKEKEVKDLPKEGLVLNKRQWVFKKKKKQEVK